MPLLKTSKNPLFHEGNNPCGMVEGRKIGLRHGILPVPKTAQEFSSKKIVSPMCEEEA